MGEGDELLKFDLSFMGLYISLITKIKFVRRLLVLAPKYQI